MEKQIKPFSIKEELYNIRTAALLQKIGRFHIARGNSNNLDTDHAEEGARLLNTVSALEPIAILIKHRHDRQRRIGDSHPD